MHKNCVTCVLPKFFGNRSLKYLTTTARKCSSTENVKKQGVNITLLGAKDKGVQLLALLLKQSPLISQLTLFDTTELKGVGMDLNHINTSCSVKTVHGMKQLDCALQDADIVVLAAETCSRYTESRQNLFTLNAELTSTYATACAKMCPDAILAVITWPINSMVPLVSEIYKQYGVYNPDKIVGMATLMVLRANSIVGRTHYLDPDCVHVPIIGGISSATSVPLLSIARPFSGFPKGTVEDLNCQIRGAGRNLRNVEGDEAVISRSYAANRFILTLVRGYYDMPDAMMTAFVRSNVLPHCKYFANQLLFGPQGVKKNFGIPKLSSYEIDLLDQSVLTLLEDIKMGQEFVSEANECEAEKYM